MNMASADKRSPDTDALAVLGTIIDDSVGRDAIHLAVEPMIAGETLAPGTWLEIRDGKAYDAKTKGVSASMGLVDPFLLELVRPGDRFLMILKPGQIATLRHVWDHPAFPPAQAAGVNLLQAPAKTDKAVDALTWLRDYGRSIGVPYDQMIQDTLRWSTHDEEPWWVNSDQNYDSLWENMDALLGTTLARGEIDLSCRDC